MDDKRNIKIKIFIDRLAQSSMEISDANLTILSNYLSGMPVGNILEEKHFISWLKNAVQQWKKSKEKYSLNVLLLIFDVIALKCSEEHVFLTINFSGLLNDVLQLIRSIPEMQTTSRVQHHFFRLTRTFLTHKSGTQWIIATNFWYEILTLTLKTNDEQIVKAGCEFLVELVAGTKYDNEIVCNSVLKLVLAPIYNLQKSTLNEENSMIVEKENNDNKLVKKLTILETFINKMVIKCCSENDFKVIDTLHERYRIDDILKSLAEQITDDELHFQLNKILSLVYYFILAKEVKTDSLEKIAKINFYAAKIHDVIRDEALSTPDFSKVLKLIHLDPVYFSSIWKDVTDASVAATEFQYQMFAFLFIPISHVLSHTIGMKEYTIIAEQSELREHFTNKVIRRLLPLTFQTLARIQYSPKYYKVEDAIAAFQHIQECCRFYDPSVVHTIAEAIVYVFSDTIEFLHHNHKMIQHIPQDFMLGILETCIYLFSEFNITWKDILETIFLVEILAKCVSLPHLSVKVLTKALQFFALSIRKDFHAQLAFVEDVVDDENIDPFGIFMKNNINHSSWEVRIESLRIVQVLVEKSFTYESVKRLIIENDLLSTILKMYKIDSQISVRISAIRCIRDAVAVKEFWEYLQRENNFHEQIMQMYYLEPDGILRGETLNLITTIYENQELSTIFLQKLYDIMTNAIFEDKFMLLKTNALIFWKKVIDQYLKNEGMLDGEFPEATFSKELKKIITFDEFQIRKCLYKVLCELSKIGCLKVFLYALNCVSNEELVQVALDLLKPFLLLCRKHFYSPAFTVSQQRPLIRSHTESISSETVTIPGSPHPPVLSLSPYPELLYDDILDLEESLELDSVFCQSLFEDLQTESPEVVQRTEFLSYVENLDFSVYYTKNKEEEEIDGVLNSILNS